MSYVVTIGADPEFFIGVGEDLYSAHGVVAGTKEEPFKVPNGAVQVDGMALEFNIDPATTEEEFTVNINSVLGTLREMVPESYDFKMQPVAEFGAEYIRAQPEEATELGCEPDLNAYTGDINPTPDANADFRTAAGHVHIGVTRELDDVEERQLIILCDLFMGLPSLAYDNSAKRRELYGKAGAYRSKPYGVEYRTLSNAWLQSEYLQRTVFNQAVLAAKNLDNFVSIFELLEEEVGVSYTCLPAIINDSDKGMAEIIGKALIGGGYV